jgi:predicted O-methyltransferase YrrM
VAVARSGDWPPFVRFVTADALDVLEPDRFDLLFADAPAGKWWGSRRTVAALRPGGLLVVDDMAAAHTPGAEWHEELARAREKILGHPELVASELRFGSDVILAVRSAP